MGKMNLKFMELAIEEAKKSEMDIPVGALIVKDDEIVAIAHNQKEFRQNSTLHSEMLVIQEASNRFNSWRLNGFDLYVTLEPCPMCASAIIQARISNVYFGSYDTQYGALGSKLDLRLVHKSNLVVKGGILEAKCDNILKEYFRKLR